MKMKLNLKFILSIISAILTITVLINSKIIAISIIESMSVCFNVLIPSIFIFLIVSDFFQKTNALKFVLKPLEPIFRILFKVDEKLTSTLFFSLICGYPTGAYLIANLLENKQISKKTASRLLCFCVNSGPAFLISAISIPLTGSMTHGVILFIAQTTAFFFVGTLCSLKAKPEKIKMNNEIKMNFSQTFVNSIIKSIKTMALICGFTITFSVIIKLFFQIKFFNIHNNLTIKALISGFLEVTNGVVGFKQMNDLNSFLAIALITSFGGLCVHCQLRAIVAKFNISFKKFYLWRIAYCTVSVTVAKILFDLNLLINATNTAATKLKPQIATNSAIASICLVFLSLALLYVDKNKSGG